MGRPAGWTTKVTGRPAMRSPGRPSVRRDVERAFWKKIAEGLTSEDAVVACGVSAPVGTRWFRERGGMPSLQLSPVSDRYLSFAEREEIALLTAQETGVREIARRLAEVHAAQADGRDLEGPDPARGPPRAGTRRRGHEPAAVSCCSSAASVR